MIPISKPLQRQIYIRWWAAGGSKESMFAVMLWRGRGAHGWMHLPCHAMDYLVMLLEWWLCWQLSIFEAFMEACMALPVIPC